MDDSMYSLGLLIALLVVLVTSVLVLIRLFGGSKADTVLLVGLSDSGKTQMFSRLINNNSPLVTYTSMQENVFEELATSASPLRIVDFPGTERMRKVLAEKWLTKERSSLHTIVAVIDSSTVSKKARDVAELLYDVLLESGKKVPVIVACNKQDITLAKAPHVISTILEKEFTLINKSRAAALTSTDGSTKRNTLTNESEFEWKQLPVQVNFIKCSAVGKDIDMSNEEEKGLNAIRSLLGIRI